MIHCDKFQIDVWRDGSWHPLISEMDFSPNYCYCPAAPCDTVTPSVSEFVPAAPGSTTTWTWDARELILGTQDFSCWAGKTISVPQGVKLPVTQGHYRVTAGYGIPNVSRCTENANTAVMTCSVGMMTGDEPGPNALCPVAKTASAEFDLPDAGDVVVEVSLP